MSHLVSANVFQENCLRARSRVSIVGQPSTFLRRLRQREKIFRIGGIRKLYAFGKPVLSDKFILPRKIATSDT